MKVRMVGVIIAATLLAALVPISGAQAATVYSTGFTRVETWYSTPLKRCFQATLTGTLKATAWHVGAGRSTGFYFGKPEIVSPVLRVRSYADCTLKKAASVKKLALRQYYYDRSCTYKPSLSAGVSTSRALSIGVSVTSVCNSFTTAYRASSYGAGSTFSQYTSGASVTWKDKRVFWQGGASKKKICVTGEYQMQPYVSSTKDDLLKYRFSDICVNNY